MNFLPKRARSRKDIEACLTCNPGQFDDSPLGDEVKAPMQVLKTNAEE